MIYSRRVGEFDCDLSSWFSIVMVGTLDGDSLGGLVGPFIIAYLVLDFFYDIVVGEFDGCLLLSAVVGRFNC